MQKIIFVCLILSSISSLKAEDVLIDVREKDEISDGMLEGASSFPLSRIQNDKEWKKDFVQMTQGKNIYLYCRSGRRSGIAQEILKKNELASKNVGGYEDLKKRKCGLASPRRAFECGL